MTSKKKPLKYLRKDKAPVVRKIRKVAIPKPTIYTTRASTRATVKKSQEENKPKEKRARSTSKEEEPKKRPKGKYISLVESNEERKKNMMKTTNSKW